MSQSNELTFTARNITDRIVAETFDDQAKEEYAYSVGIQAALFLLPLKICARERRLREQIKKANPNLPLAPVNQLGHQRFQPRGGMVMPYSPNNDTMYTGVVLDVTFEPMILHVPDILDRYYSVQVTDAYCDNQPYIGTRATGGKGGDWAFVGPEWQGELPEGVKEYRLRGNTAIVAVRLFVEDEQDLPNVHHLQNQFYLTALSQWGKAAAEVKVPKFPTWPADTFEGKLAWLQDAWQLLQVNPPTAEHNAMLKMFEGVGLFVETPFHPDYIDPAFRRGLIRAIPAMQNVIRWKIKYRGTQGENRWNVNLGIGTFEHNYLSRAEVAVQGLIIHDPEECLYFVCYRDGYNEPLNGRKKYKLHFAAGQLPPTNHLGFWSITMYNQDFQLVKNPINRQAIRGGMKQLEFNHDGSLDIYIQHDAPIGHESNWLPAPASDIFRLTFRVYLPDESLLNDAQVEEFLPPLFPV